MKKIEDPKEISQKECDAVFCDVRIDLKHTTKEEILKMLQSQVKINAELKNEIDAQHTAIKQLRENSLSQGCVQINKKDIECILSQAKFIQENIHDVMFDRIAGDKKQDYLLRSFNSAYDIRNFCLKFGPFGIEGLVGDK